MRIYLLGYMYSGKTTVGHKLALRLGYQWADLDQVFEYTFHTTIPIFFKRYGEEAFRKIEQKLLHATADQDDIVISTGGGTPCHFDNMQWINHHGTSVYFDVSPETLLRRAAASKKVRPVLAGMTANERNDHIRQQLAQRMVYYQKAQIIFPADDPDLDQLVRLLRPTTV
ncbi:MAG: shikimate kinase [Bacteroidales bacterium]|nr:shikimate kinase [Bacteroidales bacterium]